MSWVARVVTLFRDGEERLPADLAEVFAHRLPTGRRDEATNDIHGNPLVFAPAKDGKGFAITSLGKDGKPGGRGANADVIVKHR